MGDIQKPTRKTSARANEMKTKFKKTVVDNAESVAKVNKNEKFTQKNFLFISLKIHVSASGQRGQGQVFQPR